MLKFEHSNVLIVSITNWFYWKTLCVLSFLEGILASIGLHKKRQKTFKTTSSSGELIGAIP